MGGRVVYSFKGIAEHFSKEHLQSDETMYIPVNELGSYQLQQVSLAQRECAFSVFFGQEQWHDK